ncbi:hypothetical protein D3C85_773280 [compost metagenome]
MTQFVLQFFAQLLVQRAERLVHQQDARLVDQCPGNRHPLLLAAGELGRAAMGELFQLHQLEHGVDLALAFGGREFADTQREGDVVAYRQVREQRVALEYHADTALVRRHLDQ